MGCGTKCAKYTLIVFNVFFWLAGSALLGISIWALVDSNAQYFLQIASFETSQNLVKAAAITLCCVGAVIFILGFMGCCGALKENVCLLNTYTGIVIVLLAAQIAAGILAVVYKDKLVSTMQIALQKTLKLNYGQDGHPLETDAWDFMQKQFDCCGVINPTDEWADSQWKNDNPTKVVPVTCCALVDDKADPLVPVDEQKCFQAANGTLQDDEHEYYNGIACYDFVYEWASKHTAFLIGIAFGFVAVQLLVLILACCLCCNIKKDGYKEI